MELQNINKQYIKVISPQLIAGDVELIEITATYNCCSNLYQDVVTYMTPRLWEVEVPLGRIKQVTAQNVVSGLSIDLLSLEYNITSYDVEIVQPLVDAIKISLQTLTGSTISAIYNQSNHSISIGGLDTKLVMDRIFVDIEDYSLFYSNVSKKGNFFSGSDLYLTSEMFDFDEMKDGIYKITIGYFNDKGTQVYEETNCLFFDNKTQCLLAQHLSKLVKDKSETDLHMIHYALISGSNCSCNCDEMCKLFEYLWKNLVSNIQNNDCGCNR